MSLLRRVLPILLIAAVAVPALAQPAVARSYRGAVDITFPTVAGARYGDDYAGGRSGGRVHRSTDLFAPAGSPVRAARGGRVIWLPAREAGNAGFAVQVLGDDGRMYAYYHLGRAGGAYSSAVVRTIRLGGTVGRGQVLGWMGDSGNARGGSPHLHFEIHDDRVTDPYGGNRVNPYAALRRAQGLPLSQSPATPTISTAVQYGARGPRVVRWQQRLNRARPGNRMVADGVFGPATRRATIAFQQSVGLGPAGLGVVGPRTLAAMTRALARPKPTSPPPAKPKTPVASPATAGTLQLGSRGTAVVRWQRRLTRSRMVGRVAADGAFGPATSAATVAFQRRVGLGPQGLGVVGPRTRAQMRRVLRGR